MASKPKVTVDKEDTPVEKPVAKPAQDPVVDSIMTQQVPGLGVTQADPDRAALEAELRDLILKRELKSLRAEQSQDDNRKARAAALKAENAERLAYREAKESACRHRKEDERTALAGQELSNGVVQLICLKCGRSRPDSEWDSALWPPIENVGKAQGAR